MATATTTKRSRTSPAGTHYEQVGRELWHVSKRQDPDTFVTIATERGICVAVQPQYANREEWAATAQHVVECHNDRLEMARREAAAKAR